MTDLAAWLDQQGLGKYAEVLAAQEVDLDVLPDLREEDLERLGLPLGPRRRLIKAAALLRDSAAALPARPDAVAGQRASPAERRQLTVLFCDLAGSTQLSQQVDPESLRTLMEHYQRACRAVVERYEGRVAQYLGDGIMAYFGWPRAHEDDAERALRAALELVGAVKSVSAPAPLRVRIGVASGPVVVGEGGDDHSSPKLAVGETPNIAARLQALAGLDEIVIAPGTKQLAGGVFRYADLGAQTLKGILEPVRAWRVEGLSEVQGRFEARSGHLTPLVGRQDEVELLKKRWAQAIGGEGQVVLLSGEPGIGKSRLAQVLSEHVSQGPHMRLRYQCSPYHVNSAFHPIIEHLTRAAKLTPEDIPRTKLKKLGTFLAQAKSTYPHTTQLIAALLGIPSDYPALNYTPQKHKDETIKALSAQVAGLARQAPVLLILEDAHWIDPSSLEAFEQLLQAIASARILLLVTYRPEFEPKWSGQSQVTTLTLNRLTKKQTADLARRVASEYALPDPVIEQISTKTDGIPLFVEELTKVILERGHKQELDIPATLKDSLMARLDRLGSAKEIAQIGACIGREFAYRLLALVAPGSAQRRDDALHQLNEAGLLFQRGTPPEASYTFKHALIQDAAYDSLLKSRRVQIHGQIAAALEHGFPDVKEHQPELLARHCSVAERYEAASAYWYKAGEIALARVATPEAIAHLEQGLELLQRTPASDDRDAMELDLRAALGTAWMQHSGWAHPKVGENQVRAWEIAQALGRDHHTLRILIGLFTYQLCRGEAKSSLQASHRLFERAEQSGRNEFALAGHVAGAIASYFCGEFEQAFRHAEAIEAMYDQDGHHYLVHALGHDPRSVARTIAAHAQWHLGFPDRALRLADAALEHARAIGHPHDLTWVTWWHCMLRALRGELQAFRADLDAVERLATEHVLPFYGRVAVPTYRAIERLLMEDYAGAEPALAVARSTWAGVGMRQGEPWLLGQHAVCLAHLGHLDRAERLLDEALEQVHRPGWEEKLSHAELLRFRGTVREIRGDLAGAESAYREAIEIARAQRARMDELQAANTLSTLMVRAGRKEEARSLLRSVLGWFTEGFATRDLVAAKVLLDELGR